MKGYQLTYKMTFLFLLGWDMALKCVYFVNLIFITFCDYGFGVQDWNALLLFSKVYYKLLKIKQQQFIMIYRINICLK